MAAYLEDAPKVYFLKIMINRNLYIQNITIVILHDKYNDRYIITESCKNTTFK